MSQNFCTQCGEKLPEEGNFCTQCGAPVEREPAAPVNPPPAPIPAQSVSPTESKAQPSSSSRTGLYALGGVAVIAALLAVVYFAFLQPADADSTAGNVQSAPVEVAGTPETAGASEDARSTPEGAANAPDIPFPDVTRISVEEAYAGFEDGTSIFIDVRDQDSYTTMHIPGAVWMPLDEVSTRHGELPADAEILTYCT